MKFIVLLAVFYIIYRMYRIGLVNGAKEQREHLRNGNAPRPSDKEVEYTDYEEIK